jgi:choline kinase
MIERVIDNARRGGAGDFVVVTGHEGDRVEAFLQQLSARTALQISAVRAADFNKPNGHSVLAAREQLEDRFILLMCDHLFDPTILRDLLHQPVTRDEVILAVDRRLDNPLVQKGDVTKVVVADDGRILEIGKDLKRYNAYDTGIFVGSKALLRAIAEDAAMGGGGLSGGVQRLAKLGLARTYDIGDRYWIDVDDTLAYEQAEQAEINQTCELAKA